MSLKSYLVLNPIRGLCRAEGGKKRRIEPEAVIALPDAIAEGLLAMGAIAEIEAEPTVALIFLDDDGAAARKLAAELRGHSRATLVLALSELGGVLTFPDDGAPVQVAGRIAETAPEPEPEPQPEPIPDPEPDPARAAEIAAAAASAAAVLDQMETPPPALPAVLEPEPAAKPKAATRRKAAAK